MTQFIETTPGAIAASMGYQTQAPQSNYSTGQLGFAEGGLASLPRGGYMGGGIGGGGFKGRYLPGGRQGYAWYDDIIDTVTKPFKPIGRRLKKLIPKEAAGIMQMAAPFIAPGAPWAAAAMSALGQYKQKGKINPLSVALSTAPGWTNTGIANFAKKIPGVNKMKGLQGNQFLDWMQSKDMVGNEYMGNNFLRSMMDKVPGGNTVDELLFGEIGGDKRGWLGVKPDPTHTGNLSPKFSLKDTLGSVAKTALTNKDGSVDKMAVVAIMMGASSYVEAKKQIQLQYALDLEKDLGIDEDTWEATDWSNTFEFAPQVPKAHGGRVGHAMGSTQFPPNRRVYADGGRTGLQWGSDRGEGLGGEEVEADMRYEGGFMPYGEEPKADDVPARLSKDEFVFTDQAVASAGEGDVELGAERLYNVMKNLEQGGRLSEESQGEMGQGIGAII